MRLYSLSIPALTVAILFTGLEVTAPSCRAASPKESKGASTLTPVYTSAEMASFKALVKDAIAALATSNAADAATKLTQLETAWDKDEKVLKAKNPTSWTVLDKSIDRALAAMKSKNVSKCKSELEDLAKMLDQATLP